ncbi:hypothetical protein OF83DRAFT_1173138 [Amylostereum chailletii]|nr:hypothetical protein OF83DRAFT_1173138 [Amylostereum chailletii]
MAFTGVIMMDIPPPPQELYSRFMTEHLNLQSRSWARDTAQGDLHRFTYVSKAWKYEAERIIYDRVYVRGRNLLLFCRTLIERPDLAKRVRVLEFCTAGKHRRLPGELDLVKRMFQLVVNLKDLKFWGQPLYEWDVSGDIICVHRDWDVLKDVPFKLDRFVSSFYWHENLFEFLEQQPALRQFESLGHSNISKEWIKGGFIAPEVVLANCKALRLEPYMTHTFTRLPPVTHLHLRLCQRPPIEEAHGAEEVALFGEHLRVLMISRGVNRHRDDDYLAPAQIFKRFAGKTPKLSVVGMIDDVMWSPKDNKDVLRALTGNFPALKAFIWGPKSSVASVTGLDVDGWGTSEDDGYSTLSDDDADQMDKVEIFATDMMIAVPSLEFFFVVGEGRGCYAFSKDLCPEDDEYHIHRRGVALSAVDTSLFSFIDPEFPFDLFGESRLFDGRFDVE